MLTLDLVIMRLDLVIIKMDMVIMTLNVVIMACIHVPNNSLFILGIGVFRCTQENFNFTTAGGKRALASENP